jgi:hypothetical protein
MASDAAAVWPVGCLDLPPGWMCQPDPSSGKQCAVTVSGLLEHVRNRGWHDTDAQLGVARAALAALIVQRANPGHTDSMVASTDAAAYVLELGYAGVCAAGAPDDGLPCPPPLLPGPCTWEPQRVRARVQGARASTTCCCGALHACRQCDDSGCA